MTSSTPIEHHFCAATTPRGFSYHAPRVFSLVRRAIENRTLFRHFFGRDLTSRFQGTALGPFWVLVHPVFLFLVYFAVFGLGLRGTMGGGDNMAFFAVYLFSGIVCFHAITQGTMTALNSIVSNGNLVKKVAFPCELLPVVPPAVETTVFLVGFVVALVFGTLSGTSVIGVRLLALPLFLVVLLAMTVGLGLLLANLNVFVRDVRELYSIVMTPWLFMSPNFWAPSTIFGEGREWAEPFAAALNPAYCLLIAERQILGIDPGGIGFHRSVFENLGISAAWAAGFLVLGYGTFMANKHKYADVV